MGLSGAYTTARLELSPAAFDEIKMKLAAAGYSHAMRETVEYGIVIDMQGIAVCVEQRKVVEPGRGSGKILHSEVLP